MCIRDRAGSAPAAGIMTALTPSAGAGQQELQWEKENERRMAEEAARKAAARKAAAASRAQAGTDLSGRGSGRDRGPSEAQQRFERSGANANRGFTRTRYGKAYQRGGVVSLMDLLNRRV